MAHFRQPTVLNTPPNTPLTTRDACSAESLPVALRSGGARDARGSRVPRGQARRRSGRSRPARQDRQASRSRPGRTSSIPGTWSFHDPLGGWARPAHRCPRRPERPVHRPRSALHPTRRRGEPWSHGLAPPHLGGLSIPTIPGEPPRSGIHRARSRPLAAPRETDRCAGPASAAEAAGIARPGTRFAPSRALVWSRHESSTGPFS